MIQTSLNFSTNFKFDSPSQNFILTDITDYAGEGISPSDVKGVFKIVGPAGLIYENTNFASPDIDPNIDTEFGSVSIPNDVDGNPLIGNYTITYTIQVSGGVQPGTYTKSHTYDFCSDYVAPTIAIQMTADCDCAIVSSRDVTTYAIDGVNPTITRVHKLYYPANLELANLSGSGVLLQITYPDVYTGVYTAKVTSDLVYTFSDGLIVEFVGVEGVKDIDVQCSLSLCTIYCGMKKLTNRFYALKSINSLREASAVLDQLIQIEILSENYYNARQCGKPDDANAWLEKIKEVGQFDENCGCDDASTPTQVIPFCGGGGSGTTTVVAGDSNFGTAVTSSTVGLTTTYTVRLTQTYKDLILNALQSQDLSVTAFRDAGIPEEGRGVTTYNISTAGGTYNVIPGTTNRIIRLTGNGVMTSSFTLTVPAGSYLDGEEFLIDYRGTLNLDGNSITIMGQGLTSDEAINGAAFILCYYDLATTTWFARVLGRSLSPVSQQGIDYWTSGTPYVLTNMVLYGSVPTLQYVCIQAAGADTNPPTGTTSSNTWWRFVGDKSALYDSTGNMVIDATSGDAKIVPVPVTSTATDFLIRNSATGAIEKRSDVMTSALATDNIYVGVAGVATPTPFNVNTLRTIPDIAVPINPGWQDITVNSGGLGLNITVGTYAEYQKFIGSTTLAAAVTVTLSTIGAIAGDKFIFDWSATVNPNGNSVTIAGVALTNGDIQGGNVMIYAIYDGTTWIAKKINYAAPATGIPMAIAYFDVNGNIATYTPMADAGNVTLLTKTFEVSPGSTNAVSPSLYSLVVGTSNTAGALAVKSGIFGVGNNNQGPNSLLSGDSNTSNGSNNIVSGQGNAAIGSRIAIFGIGNTSSVSDNFIAGYGNVINSGFYNQVNGYGNLNNGNYNFISGCANIVAANYATTTGFRAKSYINGQKSNASGQLTTVGGCQTSQVVVVGETTNATITEFFVGADGATRISLEDNKSYGYIIRASVVQDGGGAGTVGDSKFIEVKGMIKQVSGTVSQVGANTTTEIAEDAGANTWALTVSADNVNKAIKIQGTGEASKTLVWSVTVDLFEVKR